MRVAASWDGAGMNIRLRLDPGETLEGIGQDRASIRLVTNEASVRHPDISADVHPDLAALGILTVVGPWATKRLWLDIPVSQRFSDAVGGSFGIPVGPVDHSLKARPPGSSMGLLYSGGTDSAALLGFIQSESPLIHLRRVRHSRVPNRATHLRTDVSEYYARQVVDSDHDLHVFSTDLEFLCQPFPTYPTWPALAVGAVLLADHLDLGSIASGMVLGTRYLSYGHLFNANGDNDQAWREVFNAVGLPHFRGMAGASEVITDDLVARAGLTSSVRSCQLGSREDPCWNCTKCLRKELIGSARTGEPLPRLLVERISGNAKVVEPLVGPPPYYRQHILEYVLARVPEIEGSFLEVTREHLKPSIAGTEWVGRYYTPSLDELPEPWGSAFRDQLSASVGFMSADDRLALESWDASMR